MTTIRTRGRGGMLRLLFRWVLPRPVSRLDIDLIELEGVNGYLARDIGLSAHHERPERDVF